MSQYGHIVLTLSDVLLPSEKLYPNSTPSTSEGLPWDIEYDLRLIGCELIQTAGLLLKLPQTAVATGQVLFHRYFYSSSFIRRRMEVVAMACTILAAKIEENARRVRDVVNVFHHIKQVRSGSIIQPLLIDQAYVDKKKEVINAEQRLLRELGFCVYVKHPHKMITMYLKVLEKEREKDLVQTSWNYMNDSLRTDIFLRFTPETIACACIDLAARTLQIPLPKNPPWYLIFGAKPEEVHYIMISIIRLYQHRPKSVEEIEKILNTFREKREDERKKLRPDFGSNSPAQQPSTEISITSTVASSSTPPIIAQPPPPPPAPVITTITTTTTTDETIDITTITNGTTSKKPDTTSSRESSTVKNHQHRHRRKHSSSRSRSTSRSVSRSPSHHSQKKKKNSIRTISRSRSSSRKRHRHQKDKHQHNNHTSNNHHKKDKKRQPRSSSRDDKRYSNNKHSSSIKDKNKYHHSNKQTNGVSSSSNKNFNIKLK
ncbi:unnamed protein product [Rotaria socialis]|uniref:Cyclin-like domain-containing protein n=1 Tax=Rotaria socialis TaxID=392032 RepID=A0A818UIP1_9BILA|nr:unnamed protein product [Rotaria socialis]CAF4765581.1 unnamed protein product [Rotaria socialis]